MITAQRWRLRHHGSDANAASALDCDHAQREDAQLEEDGLRERGSRPAAVSRPEGCRSQGAADPPPRSGRAPGTRPALGGPLAASSAIPSGVASPCPIRQQTGTGWRAGGAPLMT
jgi:hypothetical protein